MKMKLAIETVAMRLARIAVLLVVLTSLVGAPPALAQDIVTVPSDDKAMNAAIAKAQASLPTFFARLAKPLPGDQGFAVKIHYVTTGDSGEHIWANDVVREGDQVSATINNQPAKIPNLKMGQRVAVPLTRLTDWMYMNSGKIYGGQSIRALLPTLPKADADRLKPMLAPEN
jgi:uncharacterized protein YegJ (DUF2314 family)